MVPTIEEVDTNNKTKMETWECKYDKYNQDKNVWEKNKKCYFNLVLTHFPKELKQKIQSMSGWETAKDKQDITKLLTYIRDIFHCHDKTK